jgi:hypothetical protein
MTVSDDAITASVERLGKIIPWQQCGIGKNRIGDPLGRYLGQFSKENVENDHEEKRLNNGPEDTQNRLLVSNLNVTPNQKIQQFTIIQEITYLGEYPATRGFNCYDWYPFRVHYLLHGFQPLSI